MYFTESLTVFSWLFSILPEIKRNAKTKKEDIRLYYLDTTSRGLRLACFMAKFINVDIKRLNFTLFDSKDENGDLLWWKVVFDDLPDLQKYLCRYPAFQEIIKNNEAEEYLKFFLMRRILYFDSSPIKLMSILHFIHVIFARQGNAGRIKLFLFFSHRPWLSQVKQWAETRNVDIIPMRRWPRFSIKEISFIKYFVKQVMFTRRNLDRKLLGMSGQQEQRSMKDSSPKIAVEFYGQLNLDSPGMNSDVFFCQQASALRKDILFYFQHPTLKVSDKALDEISKHGMSAVVINPRATTTSRVPLFNYNGKFKKGDHSRIVTHNKNQDKIGKDLVQQIREYYKQKDYWYHFFLQHNIKMHITWFKNETRHFPMADALQSLGGVSVIYQRSFEMDSHPWEVTKTDLVFGFSKLGAHLGKDRDSVIPYYVVTGYLGDYRFPFVKKEASLVRDNMRRHGAERILAYFDEGTSDDPRRNIGHKVTQDNYAFLLKKVLDTPSLGVIFKPKAIALSHRRLGGIADLLERAQKTGRCYMFKETAFRWASHPPAIAALASDIAIHGHLAAGTAGLESALTGTPTLMLDREGCSKSPIYKLGEGRVVFKNWDDLWKVCQEHWNTPGGIPGFGDWSSMIDEFDSFRDGRAAERMGTYLEWVMEGLKANLSRETVLADAAERYGKMWGKDKVFAVNYNPKIQDSLARR